MQSVGVRAEKTIFLQTLWFLILAPGPSHARPDPYPPAVSTPASSISETQGAEYSTLQPPENQEKRRRNCWEHSVDTLINQLI